MANKRLNATITIGGAIAGSFKTAMGTTKTKLLEIGSTVRQLEREQRLLTSAIDTFGRMGKNVDGLRARYAAVTAEINKQRTAQERLNRAHDGMHAGKARMASAGMAIGAVAAATATAFVPVVQAAAFEKAMLGVAKQVDGARDSAGKLTPVYFEMARQIQLLGREVPIATNELALMAAAGARMGVASKDLVEFTRQAAMMAAAFDLPADELADQMGKIAGLYKIPIPAIGALADSINYLDDNAIAKGGDIIDFLTRVGGVAGSVKITGTQVAALGSTLLTLGERSETASTATNALFQKLAAADKGTAKFKSAMEEIGMSTAAVQKGMQIDAQGTILQVLEAINKMPAEKRMGIMVELIGLEHSDTIAKLAGNVEEYRKQIAMAGSQKAEGSMSREFQAQMQTTSAQWEVLKNRAVELGVNIGSVLLPAVNSVLGVIGPIASATADWVRENGALVGNIATLVGTMAGIFVATKAVSFGFGLILFAFNALKIAMMTNPLGLALVLLASAAVLIYKNWEPIKAFFIGLWDGIVGAAKWAWDWFLVNLQWNPLALIVNNWTPITTFFTELWADITATARQALDWIIGKIEAIGQTWQKTKAFFGMGDDPAPGKNGAAGAPGAAAPLPKIPAPGAKGTTNTDNSQHTYHITQQPGQDTKALADELEKRRKQDAAVRGRSSLVDGAGAQ